MKNFRKVLSFVFLLLFMFTLVPKMDASAYVGANKIESKSQYENEIVRLIVQLGNESVIDGKSKESIDSMQARVKSEIEAKIQNVKYRRSYNLLVNGFSIETQRKNASFIRGIKGVTSVREAIAYYPTMFSAPKITQAYNLVSSKRAAGEGVVVSIIDTGIDTQHKDMRLSDFSKAKIKDIKQSSETKYTEKVPYGYNFADNNDIVKDAPYQSMHGMHVAGIVAANATDEDIKNFSGIRGAAPEAQLLAMKVFSNEEGKANCFDDDIVAAIEDSIVHKADIINMSLGSPMGVQDESDPVAKAFAKARAQGVLCLVAAGNEQIGTTVDSYNRPKVTNDLGMKDVAIVGSPSTFDDSFSIASMDNNGAMALRAYFSINGVDKETYYRHSTGPYVTNNTEVVDGGKALSNTLKDDGTYKGKIVLVERGDLSFTLKAAEVARVGGKGMILYNSPGGNSDGAGLINPTVEAPNPNFSIDSIQRSVGLDIKKQLGESKKVLFRNTEEAIVAVGDGPLKMSSFTSWGPTQNLDFKPELSAPGGGIYSTLNDSKYGNMSGTSMATPHAAGLSAMMYQRGRALGLSGADIADFVKIALMNTSKVMKDETESNGVYYSPRRQGAGLAQVESAFNTNVVVKYGKEGAVALKSFQGNKSFDVTFKNYGDKPYSFDVVPSDVLTQGMAEKGELFEITATGFSVSSGSSSVTVPAKGETTLTLTVNSPRTLDNFVEGFVMFNSKDASQPDLHIPYMGFSGDYGTMEPIFENPVYDNNPVVYGETKMMGKTPLIGDRLIRLGNLLVEGDNNIKSSTVAFSPNGDNNFDRAYLRMVTLRNTEDMTIEVVKENNDSAPTLRQLNTFEFFRRPQLEKYLDKKKKNIDPVYQEEFNDWDGTSYDKSTGEYKLAEDGQYYIRMKARINKDSQYQTKYVPITLDTKAPEVSNVSAKENADGTYSVTFTAKDSLSGVMVIDSVFMGNEKAGNIASNGDVFTASFDAKPADTSSVQIRVYDNALNETQFVQVLSGKKIVIANYDAMVNNTLAFIDENNNMKIAGSVSSDIKSVKIGKDEKSAVSMTMDKNNFTGSILLTEGDNVINAFGYDKDGKLIVTEKFNNIFLDKNAPEVTYTAPAMKDGVATVTTEEFTLSGNVKDNHFKADQVKLMVMGTQVPVNADGSFTTKVKVPLNRVVVVNSYDPFGNSANYSFRVNYESKKGDDGFFFTNLDNWMSINKENKNLINGEIYPIKGYITSSSGKLEINGTPVAINSDLSFTHNFKFAQGNNGVNIKYTNAAGTVTFNYKYRVFFDTKLPEFVLDNPEVRDGKIYTNASAIEFIGRVFDNAFGYNMKINGNLIKNFVNAYATGPEINERKFNFNQKDVNDKDIMSIEVVDGVGNGINEKYTVVKDTEKPIITIKNVENGKMYEPGVLPEISVNEPTKSLIINLNGKEWDGEALKSGEYVLEVKATDYAGNVETKTVVFRVDAKPVFEVESIDVKQNTNPDLKKLIKVTDVEDGDLSSSVQIMGTVDFAKPGSYKVAAVVTDKAGNTVAKEITVNVKGLPQILGVSNKSIMKNEVFNPMDGVTATDFEDKDITGNIKVEGTVDNKTVGTYKLTYSVTDSDGNTAEKTAVITVTDTPAAPGGNDGKDAKEVVLTDEVSGIKVIGNTESLNPSWQVKAVKIDKTYKNLKSVAYDITLTDGTNTVQPIGNRAVTVSIPVDTKEFDLNKVKAFYDNKDVLETLTSYIKNESIMFNTNHFSIYVVGSEIASSEDSTQPKDNNSDKGSLPDTGERNSMAIPAVGGMLVLIAVGILVIRKKKH